MAMHETHSMSDAEYVDHERTFEGVMRIALIGMLHILSILVGLAIGGTEHRWVLAGFWMVVATLAALLGFGVRSLSWRPGAVILVVMLATLAMARG